MEALSMHIRKAEFSRVIPNNGILYGEVKVWPVKEESPMLAWFVREADGCLNLVKLIRKQEELALDWYDNDLRHAFDDVTESWFTDEQLNGGCSRTEFEKEILDSGDVAAVMEQRLWDSQEELSHGVPFSPFTHKEGEGEADSSTSL
jgi:hypothetical protein